MRDNREGMPEIVDALEESGRYFGVVQLEREGVHKHFRFGVSQDGYSALKRTLQVRPFEQIAGTRYRYFFVPTTSFHPESRSLMMVVRVEHGRDGKQVEIESPRDLIATLKWFDELDDWQKAQHLAVAV